MLNCLTRRDPTAIARRYGLFFLIGVLLALVKCDCQVAADDAGVMLLTP